MGRAVELGGSDAASPITAEGLDEAHLDAVDHVLFTGIEEDATAARAGVDLDDILAGDAKRCLALWTGPRSMRQRSRRHARHDVLGLTEVARRGYSGFEVRERSTALSAIHERNIALTSAGAPDVATAIAFFDDREEAPPGGDPRRHDLPRVDEREAVTSAIVGVEGAHTDAPDLPFAKQAKTMGPRPLGGVPLGEHESDVVVADVDWPQLTIGDESRIPGASAGIEQARTNGEATFWGERTRERMSR